jgi:hypothetical protein
MILHTHRSTAYVKPIGERGTARKPEAITNQFRFVVRMAVACCECNVPYDLTWSLVDGVMGATITAMGTIPMPKPLPKAPKLKIVADWKPAIWDAVYRLDAYHDGTLNRMRPGFVIAHSCGLSLVHPSESGELGVTEHGADEDIRQGWLVTHTASGKGFGLTLNFKRATDALHPPFVCRSPVGKSLLAATFAVDWTQDTTALGSNPEFRRAGYSVQAAFSSGFEKDSAKRRLAELGRAA